MLKLGIQTNFGIGNSMVVSILENSEKCTRCMKSHGFHGAQICPKKHFPFFRYILNILLLDAGKYPRIIRKICHLSRIFLCLQEGVIECIWSAPSGLQIYALEWLYQNCLQGHNCYLQSDVKSKLKMFNQSQHLREPSIRRWSQK